MRRLTFVFALVLLWASSAAAQVVITPTPMGSTVGKPFPQLYITASGYVSFGTTGGSSGYGFRDNGGTMQMKNSGGAWFDVPASTASAGGWTDTGTVVQLATGTDTVYIQSSGPHSVGATALDYAAWYLAGTFTSGGASSAASAQRYAVTITGASGDTLYLAGENVQNSVTTQASDTVAIVAQARFAEPNITVGAGGTVTDAATVYIADAPTEGTRNYSIFNDSTGLSRFDGPVVIGSSASSGLSSKMTSGITLRQGSADNEILSLFSSDIAHGITDFADTDAYAVISKFSDTAGGVYLKGFSETLQSIMLASFATTEDTTRSASGNAYGEFRAYLKSGASVSAPGANANVWAFRSGSSSRWIVDSEGDTWQNGDITAANLESRTGIVPDANDGAYLGTSSLSFSDLFLASGGVINWNNGNVTLTHSAGKLTTNGILETSASMMSGTGNPATEGAFRVSCAGVSPARVCSVLLYDGGAVRTLASMTY
jgi:hypothetical protein